MTNQRFRRFFPIVFLLLAAAFVRADEGADIARIHLEAIGGHARLAAFRTLRATGYVQLGEKRLAFKMLAARPDRVRLETTGDGRTLIHASDGVAPPWELEPDANPPRVRTMSDQAAKLFTADAEFDDPLVAGPARGYGIDFAGEMEIDGRKLLRVLVTKNLAENFFLLLDPNTYFIVLRIEERPQVGGRKRKLETRYDDFRPVDGVLLAHRITLSADGRVQQETVMESIETNVDLPPDTFTRPMLVAPLAK